MKTFNWILETGGSIELPDETTEEQAKQAIREELIAELSKFNDSIIIWES